MRTTTRLIALLAGFGFAGCGGQEPEAVEPETTETAGGAMTTQPQAGSEMQARGELGVEEQGWGEPGMEEHAGVAGEPYGHQQGMEPGMQQGMQPGTQASPEQLRVQIEEALRGAPNLDDNTINVRVVEGDVHLAGLVDSPTEIRIAHDVAHAIPGVQNVYVDELRVQ